MVDGLSWTAMVGASSLRCSIAENVLNCSLLRASVTTSYRRTPHQQPGAVKGARCLLPKDGAVRDAAYALIEMAIRRCGLNNTVSADRRCRSDRVGHCPMGSFGPVAVSRLRM